ncbi:MAG: dipeptide epimerase [Chitinophagaceae bacterium]|nr:dipeptide epimerase [Chitinophagaceae bacterium]MBK9660679.1 dipeptide epimerase [Chitinophagaceae bacterium]MBL0068794.1 dipeptide epimerase [Chitinophagaceae bacterium]MBP6234146.1 dipeptide epimerase [Chitinophagaceae bacterium]MBP6415623.1 dipeptide epimerase [Chitinophagaceae bacterium]
MNDNLLIQQVELYKLSIPLKEPFVTSLGTDVSADNVLVKIITNRGIIGFGECSPYMPINGESQDTCFIVGQYFAKALKGKDPLQIEDCINLMDKIIYGNTSIKSAFDIALYDIASQYAGVPLYKFLGGENNKTIITDYTVSIGEPEKMAADALKIKNEGYPAIKIKLGKRGKTDVERIKAIRAAVGKKIPLRIDANQGWKVNEAIETLKALAKYDIQHCEEPIARWKFLKLRKIKKNSPIPIMADESCGDDHDAERLIELKACDYFNIKLGKSGGIFKALKIVRLAEAAGKHLQVGAMIESRLAMTAFAHFALCSPLIEHFDFDTALMFSEDPVTGGIVYEKNGVVKVPETIGLGATIDEGWLGKMEKVVI